MRHAVEEAFLSMIGYVNRAVFFASRGRLVPYRFHGSSAVLVTITGPATPGGQTVSVGYLPDGADYVVLAAETDDGLATALRAATSATIELASQDDYRLTSSCCRATPNALSCSSGCCSRFPSTNGTR